MYEHVALELVGPAECATASRMCTRKRSLARVRSDMFSEVTRLDKSLATVRTHEGFVAIVCAFVNRQRRRDCKSLAAAGHIADIWLVVRMAPEMGGQWGSLGKALSTNMADKRSVTRMALQVSQNFLTRSEDAALFAATSVPKASILILASAHVFLGQMLHQVTSSRKWRAVRTARPATEMLRGLRR